MSSSQVLKYSNGLRAGAKPVEWHWSSANAALLCAVAKKWSNTARLTSSKDRTISGGR
jgi:hypothetical protein